MQEKIWAIVKERRASSNSAPGQLSQQEPQNQTVIPQKKAKRLYPKRKKRKRDKKVAFKQAFRSDKFIRDLKKKMNTIRIRPDFNEPPMRHEILNFFKSNTPTRKTSETETVYEVPSNFEGLNR